MGMAFQGIHRGILHWIYYINVQVQVQDILQSNGLRGNTVQVDKIDTAMYLVPLDYYCNKPWCENFIYSCPQEDWVYVNNDICTYNRLKDSIVPQRGANGNIL